MDVTTDFDWSVELEEHGLGHEDLSGSDTEASDFLLGEVNLFAWTAASYLEEFVDDVVNV